MVNRSNINAAKELVALYRSITKKQLQDKYDWLGTSFGNAAGALTLITGFGMTNKCGLCKTGEYINECRRCLYYTGTKKDYSYNPCCMFKNAKTYDAIRDAQTISELFIAIQNRADHLEARINKIELSKTKIKEDM